METAQDVNKRSPDDHCRHKNWVLPWISEQVLEKLSKHCFAGDMCFGIHGHNSLVVEDMNSCQQLLRERYSEKVGHLCDGSQTLPSVSMADSIVSKSFPSTTQQRMLA
jgi:hypothetical protein